MKTQEEIDEVYKKLYLSLDDSPHYHTWVRGYTQCQEDMELSDWDVTLTDGLEEEEWGTKPAQSPKEKAEELVNKYCNMRSHCDNAEECALIAVNECIELHFNLNGDTNGIGESFKFWNEVKEEIEKL